MAQGAVSLQRQQSLGDLEQLLSKERPFEGRKKRHERRISDPQIDEIDNVLFKNFKSPPDIEKNHQNLVPHLLALHRIKKCFQSFLSEKAKEIAGNNAVVTSPKTNTDRTVLVRRVSVNFQFRKMAWLNRLSIYSFLYELVMKIVRDRQKTEKETVQELSELSNYIASAQLVIDDFRSRLSSSYESTDSTETEMAQFRSKLETIDEKIEETKLKANFETREGDLHLFFSVPSRICYALGLNVDFLQWFNFESFPEDIQNHRSIEDWICNFLRQRYEETMQNVEQSALSEAEVLETIGFRPNSMAPKIILARASQLQAHLELIDSVELFIKNEFKYDFVLSEDLRSRFPISLPLLNEWFPLFRTPADEEETRLPYIINLEQQKGFESKLKLLPCEDSSQTFMFHGTDHESALDILSQGIDINIGCQKRDFSDGAGFYLTNDLDKSVKLAFGKTSKPAVLVYRVSTAMLSNFSKLSLCSEEKDAEWKAVVSQFRSGRPNKRLRRSLEKIDFIEGPMANSYKIPPVAKEGSYQMCVISDDLAEELDSCVWAVAFFDGSATEFCNS